LEDDMSSIGGPGGVGGPKGPGGPDGPGGVDGADEISDTHEVGDASAVRGNLPAGIDALAADIAAGKITPREAVDRLVDEIAGTDQIGATERAELRELITDMVANDPYLSSLVGRI
jgi:hypothetical protein